MRNLFPAVAAVGLAACAAPALDAGGTSASIAACPELSPSEVSGAGLGVYLRLCARDQTLYMHNYDSFEFLTPDGQSVGLIRSACFDCASCPNPIACDVFPSVGAVEPGEVRTMLAPVSGHRRAANETCPGTTAAYCTRWEEIPAGRYTARLCISRSLETPQKLGPLECVELPFDYPFQTRLIGARFQ